MAKTDFSKLNSDIQKAADNRKKYADGGFSKKFEKVEWMKIPFGDTTFMVLPPLNEEIGLYHEVFVHHNFSDPANPDKKRSYQCSKKLHGSCPICTHVSKLKEQGLTKEASNLEAKRTFLYNVMDVDGNVKVAPMKPSQHTEVRQEVNTNYIDNDVDVTDPKNGKLIKLSRLKASPWARARVLGKVLEMSENKVTEVLAKLKDLTKVYIDNTPEELARVLNGEEVNRKTAATTSEEDTHSSEETVVEAQEVKKAEPVKAVEKAAPKAKAEPLPAAVTKAKETTTATKVAEVTPAKDSTGDAELDSLLTDLELK